MLQFLKIIVILLLVSTKSGFCAKTHGDCDVSEVWKCQTPFNQVCAASDQQTYAVGWDYSCSVPVGGGRADSTSCMTTNNMLGEIADTLATLGIGILMRSNFCGAEPGHTEGQFIANSFASHCDVFASNVALKQKCKSLAYAGIKYSPSNYRYLSDDDIPIVEHANNENNIGLCNAAPNFSKPAVTKDGAFVTKITKDSGGNEVTIPVYCPLTRCNIPTNNILAKYFDDAKMRAAVLGATTGAIGAIISLAVGDCVDTVNLTCKSNSPERLATDIAGFLSLSSPQCDDEWVGFMNMVHLRSIIKADQICTQMNFGISGWTTLHCKPRPMPLDQIANAANECSFVGRTTSCVGNAGIGSAITHSRSLFPLTARMMECVNDLLGNTFGYVPGSGPASTSLSKCKASPLAKLQNNIQKIVSVLLTLYVIFFGFQIALGGKIPEKKEFAIFLMKFVLVVYFSIGGFNLTTEERSDYTSKKNGLLVIQQAAMGAINDFANMVAGNDKSGAEMSGGPGAVCKFDTSKYDSGYQYLALWDSLDCRIAYYLGLKSHSSNQANSNSTRGGVFAYLQSALLSFNPIFLLFSVCFGILMLSIVIYVAHVYILALIMLAVMVFFGPIFIPLALFKQTEETFKAWRQLILGYTLQPAVMVVFISIMVLTFNTVIYGGSDENGGCKFTYKPSSTINVKSPPMWIMDIENQSNECQSSMGYYMNLQVIDALKMRTGAFGSLFKIDVFKNAPGNFVKALLFCTFFAFLFYYFAKQLGGFAAELTKSTDISKGAISPTAIVDKVIDGVKKIEDYRKGKVPPPKPPEAPGVAVQAKAQRAGVSVAGGTRDAAVSGVSTPAKEGG